MWEKHGTFAVGEAVFDAFDMIDILSKSARIFFMVKQAGFEPEGLTDAQMDELIRSLSFKINDNMAVNHFLAIDLGAESGTAVAGILGEQASFP